jgi:hypothetical protein
MTSGFGDISLGHVEPDGGEPEPRLFDEIEATSGTAADVEKPEAALIAPGKYLVARPQRLPPGRVGRSAKKHLDLRIPIIVGGTAIHSTILPLKHLKHKLARPAKVDLHSHAMHTGGNLKVSDLARTDVSNLHVVN